MLDLAALVLKHVNAANYKPVKPGMIAKQLDLPDKRRGELKKTIKQLVKQGQLQYGSNHLVQPRQANVSGGVLGVFRRTSRGFGFVRRRESTGQNADDIYIPERQSKDASSGDVVQVQINKRRGSDQRLRGEIIGIVERKTHQFVGTYFEDAGIGLVRVDGQVFGKPIHVGDAGAKSARAGDKVVIEMVRFPSHVHEGEGVVTEVLGPQGAPGVDTLSIMRQFNLPEDFPESVLEAARRVADDFDESLDSDRVDLTDLVVITIDPKDARDFDDAISLQRIERRHWRLGVHIADVSHFVQPGSSLDREARDRATSVYLPDRVIPMLPEIISNNLASLQPDRVRYTKSVIIEFTPEGTHITTDVHSAAIKSRRRFTYEDIDDFLENPAQWKRKLKPEVFQLLNSMYDLAMILRARRFQRGSLELSLPETKIDLDCDGNVCGAHRVQYTESHQIIEEFMLTANEAVAQMLEDAELLFLRRIHEPPDPRKLKALNDFVRELGIKTDGLESRFELQRVLQHVRGLPQEQAVHYATLRSMSKAVYSPNQEGHFALASDCYCHFTSPIRRYPDLTVHRLTESLTRRRRPSQDQGRLVLEGEHCSDREHRAESAERELTKLKLLHFVRQRIGQEMDAVITGVESFGLFAQGTELPAEGLIHVDSLQDDSYRFDRTTHSLNGNRSDNSFRLGDMVRVEIAHVDLDARTLDLRLVRRMAHSSGQTESEAKVAERRKKSKKKTGAKTKRPAKTKHAKNKKTKKSLPGASRAKKQKKKKRR